MSIGEHSTRCRATPIRLYPDLIPPQSTRFLPFAACSCRETARTGQIFPSEVRFPA